MRVFTVSDLHVDYGENLAWLEGLSQRDYTDDLLIVAGDVSDSVALLRRALTQLKSCFAHVLFVPGNHDLWVADGEDGTSLDKFARVCEVVRDAGVGMSPLRIGALAIVPLLGWYDYSFGTPSARLRRSWVDFKRCRWPTGGDLSAVCGHFAAINELAVAGTAGPCVSFSHFLPRLDVMPQWISAKGRLVYPVLGSSRLEAQVRRLGSLLHIYGHSHVNGAVRIEGTWYVNNAFGYPDETAIAAKRLKYVCDTQRWQHELVDIADTAPPRR
jgi:predicted phosphodiesterase